MKKPIKISIATFACAALAAVAVTSNHAVPMVASAESDPALTEQICAEQTMDYEISAQANTLRSPIVSVNVYNAAVEYVWSVGSDADALAMYTSANASLAPDIFKKDSLSQYRQVAFITNYDKECRPHYIIGAAYNTSTKEFSEKVDVSWEEITGPNTTTIHYGRDAKYKYVGQLFTHYISREDVPTSYDKQYFIWSHGSSNGHIIKGTICYAGAISDIEVTIPWIGYKASSVTVNGVTFSIRTGPNKCSIRAEQSGVSGADLRFGFGVL